MKMSLNCDVQQKVHFSYSSNLIPQSDTVLGYEGWLKTLINDKSMHYIFPHKGTVNGQEA